VILSQAQIDRYRKTGFLAIDSLFSADEVDLLCDGFREDSTNPGPHRIQETDGDEVRAVYASHLRRREFATLVRSPRMLGPVRQLLTDDVYVYQLKTNAKPAFGGDRWAWHQDYVAWKIADNLPAPSLVNVGLFLDDVTEFNGPLILLPGSHRSGLVRDTRNEQALSAQHLDPDDISLKPAEMRDLVDRHGMASMHGKAGSVVFFSPEIVHGSGPNMSPFSRRLLLVTYNDVANQPTWPGEPRPEYLVGRLGDGPLQITDEPLLPLPQASSV
jgi:ectoine hydroxylase